MDILNEVKKIHETLVELRRDFSSASGTQHEGVAYSYENRRRA